MLNRVLALRKIDKKGSVVSRLPSLAEIKRGIATARSFSWKGRTIAVSIELWPYFSFNGEGGGVTCYRPFIIVAQNNKTKHKEVGCSCCSSRCSTIHPHKCIVAPCLSSNPATDGSASSKMQNLRLNSKSRRCLQANNKFADRVPL